MKKLAILLCCIAFVGAGRVSAQGKFSGYMFGDYFYNIARDTAFSKITKPAPVTSGSKDFQAFQIRRVYLTYDNDISEKFTTRFRLEGNLIAVEGTSAPASQLFIKDAFLRWKNVFEGSDLIFGMQPTTAYDLSESVWGYRSLEKTIMDLRGIISSRDLGISLKGKIDEAGVFNYWLMFANNSGNNAENDKYKRYSLTLTIRPVNKIIATLTGDFRSQAQINDPSSTTVPKATLSNNVLTYAGFLAYQDPDHLTLGVEAFMMSTQHGEADPADATGKTLKGLNAFGLTVFGVCNFQPDLALVLRYDLYNPNTDSAYPLAVPAPGYASSLSRNYIIGGLSWKPDKNVSIIPNVQFETYQTPRHVVNAHSIDPAVTGRVTFYYVFL